jgi:hypothetical protein
VKDTMDDRDMKKLILAGKLVEATLEGDQVTRLLIGNLVSFLMKNGTVSYEDYFQFTQQTKKYLIETSEDTSESKVKMIESIFDLHLDDLKEIKAIEPKKT